MEADLRVESAIRRTMFAAGSNRVKHEFRSRGADPDPAFLHDINRSSYRYFARAWKSRLQSECPPDLP